MGILNNVLKGGTGGGAIRGLITSAIGMVAGKIIADKMQKKILKQQTGFETTEELMADAQAKAAKAQAEAEAQAAQAYKSDVQQ